jgi:hypothetical protein
MESPAKTNLANAIPIKEICRGLLELSFAPVSVRALKRNDEFCRILYKQNQVCFVNDYCRNMINRPISVNELAIVFSANPRTVRKYLLNGPQEPSTPGRHKALSEEAENQILQKLKDQYESNSAFTRNQLMGYVSENFDKSISRGWLNAFIGRHLDEIKVCRSFPQEDSRFVIPREHLNEHIINMQRYVSGKIAELVFNLDEVGSSDWEDRKTRKVLVPASVDSDDVFHPVSRKYKHMTLLVCVSAGGDALCPMLIVANEIPPDMGDRGLRLDEDVMIRTRNPPYINEQLFFEYLSTVLVPYIIDVREKIEKTEERAILLMDGMTAHTSERVLSYLGRNNVAAIIFPSHTTNLFQALDLSFFGALKRRKATTEGEYGDQSFKNQVSKLIRAYEGTASSVTIRGSFQRAGFKYIYTKKPYLLEFDEAVVRKNPGFEEIWSRNYTVEDLRRRRCLSPFGLINSEYLPE